MANKKSSKTELEKEKQSVEASATTAVPSERETIDNVEVNNKQIKSFSSRVDSFQKTNVKRFQEYSEWEELFFDFENIYKELEEYSNSLSEYEYESVREQIESTMEELNYSYDRFLLSYNSWNIRKIKSMEERTEKQQLINFAVFSLFMTLLTFLLSNIVILTKTDFTIKTIVVINLILLLVCTVVFLFIGVFFGLIKQRSKVGTVFKYLVMSLLPFAVATALILVSILM